jgi:hypothetical protein
MPVELQPLTPSFCQSVMMADTLDPYSVPGAHVEELSPVHVTKAYGEVEV